MQRTSPAPRSLFVVGGHAHSRPHLLAIPFKGPACTFVTENHHLLYSPGSDFGQRDHRYAALDPPIQHAHGPIVGRSLSESAELGHRSLHAKRLLSTTGLREMSHVRATLLFCTTCFRLLLTPLPGIATMQVLDDAGVLGGTVG